MGVVLNRPSETTVGRGGVDALAGLADSDELVRLGGPVSPESVVALGEFEDPDEAASPVLGSLGLLDPDGPGPGAPPAAGVCGLRRLGPGPARRRA